MQLLRTIVSILLFVQPDTMLLHTMRYLIYFFFFFIYYFIFLIVKFKIGGGAQGGFLWDCDVCNESLYGPSALLYPEDPAVCNCSEAIDAFITAYGGTFFFLPVFLFFSFLSRKVLTQILAYFGSTPANAFDQWLTTYRFYTGIMAIWRCDLCPNVGK